MTFIDNQLQKYYEFTTDVFNFLNGRVNQINRNCSLEIDWDDFISNKFGEIRYPNNITIFINRIVRSWNDEWSDFMNKNDYIYTTISWSVCHELLHADQYIIMHRYNTDADYTKNIELSVEISAYNLLLYYQNALEYIGHFHFTLNHMKDPSEFDTGKTAAYQKVDVRQFYLQTILNCVMRNFNSFKLMVDESDIDTASDIIINFNNIDRVCIKRDDEWLDINTGIFSQVVYKWTGYYDKYSLEFYTEKYKILDSLIVEIKISVFNRELNGLLFKE